MSEEHKTDVDENNAGDNQDDQNTGDSDNQNNDDNQSSDQKPADNSNQDNNSDNQSNQDNQDDSKEHNRKGYEKRKGAETGVSREEFDDLKEDVTTVKGENEKLKFQKANPWCTDELYNSLEAQSKGSSKSKEDIIKDDPVWKNYLDTTDAKNQVDEATAPPSTRTTSGNNKSDYKDMSSEDFQAKREEVLQRQGE